MFDEWSDSRFISKPYLQSFFSPVREVLLFDEDMGVFQALTSLVSDKLVFLDPYHGGDKYAPVWKAGEDQPVDALLHPSLQISGLVKVLTKEEEENQIRLAIHEIDAKKIYHNAGNPLNPLRLETLRARLQELVLPALQKQSSKGAAARVQKPGTNLPTEEPGIFG